MKELEKKGCNEQERKMQKALDDVIGILDRHCEQGELKQETHDKILSEMKRIFQNSSEEEKGKKGEKQEKDK